MARRAESPPHSYRTGGECTRPGAETQVDLKPFRNTTFGGREAGEGKQARAGRRQACMRRAADAARSGGIERRAEEIRGDEEPRGARGSAAVPQHGGAERAKRSVRQSRLGARTKMAVRRGVLLEWHSSAAGAGPQGPQQCPENVARVLPQPRPLTGIGRIEDEMRDAISAPYWNRLNFQQRTAYEHRSPQRSPKHLCPRRRTSRLRSDDLGDSGCTNLWLSISAAHVI